MRIIHIQHQRAGHNLPTQQPSVLALGFFDGVHQGHRELLQEAKRIAEERELLFGVLTFYPHPREIVQPGPTPMQYLTPIDVKADILSRLGVERMFILHFNSTFSRLSAHEFVDQYILGLNCKHVVVGFDYRYGYKGAGCVETLADQGKGKFDVSVIEKIEHQGNKISSTTIRALIFRGKVELVPPYLGGYYSVRGKMLIDPYKCCAKVMVEDEYILPISGRYLVQIECDQKAFAGICIGIVQHESRKRILFIELAQPITPLNLNMVEVKWIKSISQLQEKVGVVE